jgi:hypothetical protein
MGDEEHTKVIFLAGGIFGIFMHAGAKVLKNGIVLESITITSNPVLSWILVFVGALFMLVALVELGPYAVEKNSDGTLTRGAGADTKAVILAIIVAVGTIVAYLYY